MARILGRNKRKYLRYLPDEGTFALIDLDPGVEFEPNIVALVYEEGYGGCGLVILKSRIAMEVGQSISISVGNLPVMEAQIRWIREVDDLILRLGICYGSGEQGQGPPEPA